MRPFLVTLAVGVVLLPGAQHAVADLIDPQHGMHGHCHLVFEERGHSERGHSERGHSEHRHSEHRHSEHRHSEHVRSEDVLSQHGDSGRPHDDEHGHSGRGHDHEHTSATDEHVDAHDHEIEVRDGRTVGTENVAIDDDARTVALVLLPLPCSAPDHEVPCPHAPLEGGHHSHAMPPMLTPSTPSALAVWSVPRTLAYGVRVPHLHGRTSPRTLDRPPRV